MGSGQLSMYCIVLYSFQYLTDQEILSEPIGGLREVILLSADARRLIELGFLIPLRVY